MKSINQEIITDFLDTIEASEKTRIGYTSALNKYSKFHEVPMLELLEEAEQDMLDKVVPRKSRLVKRLTTYNLYLTDNYSQTTKHSYMAAVLSFYKTNGISVPRIGKSKKTENIKKENRYTGFSNDDVKTHINACFSLRDRALLFLMSSSGIAKKEVRNLLRSDFEGHQDQDDVTTFDMHRFKTNFNYTTFCSPEATRAVKDYLKGRKDDNPYLFVTNGTNHHEGSGRHQQISERGWDFIFRRLGEKVGFDKKPGQFIQTRSHNYRKFFQSTLQNNGCDIWLVDFMMGHNTESVRSAYYEPEPEKLKEKYKEVMHHLYIEDKSFELLKDDEIKRLRASNKHQAEEVAILKEQMQTIMKEQAAAVQAMIQVQAKFSITP